MKKIWIGLLCVWVLLSGCTETPPPPTQTEPPTTPSQSTESPLIGVPLLEQGIAQGENLLYIPNDAVEGMICPEVWLYGNRLLLGSHIRDQYVLRQISLEDGRLLAECSISASPGVKVRIGNGCIGLLDSGTNRFLMLNEDLTLRSTQSIPLEGDNWYLSPELDRLYCFYTDQGLLVRDLLTGEEQWIVADAVFTKVIGAETEYILFEYTDVADQRTYTRCLNLATGILETLPTSDSIRTGIRRGQTWLLEKNSVAGNYILSDSDATVSFTCGGSVTLLSPRRHLLVTDHPSRSFQLYDTQGHFLSACPLPEAAGTNLVWSGYWDGYFFVDTMENNARLMFWDISVETQGTDLEFIPLEPSQKVESVLDASLYKRAETLSERFGVKILIAEQCPATYSHYNAYQLTDPYFIGYALDLLEECLGMYPEGFFRQLPYGSFHHIQIELIGELTLKDGMENQPASTAAFVQEQDGYINVVLEGFVLQPETVYHEFSHVIDRRLSWDAQIREDADFSEAKWLSFQPAGFAYAMSYTELPEAIRHYGDTGYFISDYSMTYPTEDRATLFAEAMAQSPMLKTSPALQAKMDYYAQCIRDCFHTEGWPEVTAWELVLK